MRHAPALKKISRNGGLVHVFFPYLVDFLTLRNLPGPVLYTITSGVDADRLPVHPPPYTLVVSSDREAEILDRRGYRDVQIIRPGIDLTRINPSPPQEPENDFVILAGSAPWTPDQFRTKGFDLLLETLRENTKLRLVCLWRGALYREWEEKVRGAGLSDRVEIIRERTDVSRVLARCHCAMVLASTPDLVKSYPNSLMEALVAGRPVITSRAIPMSGYVEETGCGRVIDDLSRGDLSRRSSRSWNDTVITSQPRQGRERGILTEHGWCGSMGNSTGIWDNQTNTHRRGNSSFLCYARMPD